ncbi:MAG: DDE-type integrase/transposase/recombinase [Thaumarchaeota archaeon]|nr:DDE-type integrase/transposase/recombinase [Nitrososphaerota archaeon]
MLDEKQVEWIIKAKIQGKRNMDIADAMGISSRRVRQLYSQYRKTGAIPVLRKPGRHRAPEVTVYEREVIKEAYGRFRMCACYLEKILSAHGVRINHKRIHRVLREEGYALNEPRKQRRRKWIRYEREHSNSLWHTDWHRIKDPRWRGQWLIAYEDDASRFITGFGVYPTLTSRSSVEVFDRAVRRYGKPRSILSDHGTTFYAVEAESREKGLTEFEKYLLKNKIRFIMGRVDHPQTNGKIEKFFDIFEKKVRYFQSVEEFMEWYNCERPHGAFDLSKLETPVQIFYKRMEDREQLTDPDTIPREEMIL